MSFFSSNKNEPKTQDSHNIPKDILAQVRVMGEKPASPLGSQSTPAPSSPTQLATENPVSNPFIHPEESLVVPQPPVAMPVSQAPQATSSQVPEGLPVGNLDERKELLAPMEPVGPNPFSPDTPQTHGSHSSKILIIGSIIAVALILMLGIYFYLEQTKDAALKQQADQVALQELETATQPTNSSPETTTEPSLETSAFSTTRANYFSLDPETATRDSILAEIKGFEEKILASQTVEPIVFQVTDQNNIPLAMSRFAYLMEFGPGEDIISALDEDFTLVLYVENGKVRRALATKLKEETENPSEMLTKYEAIIPATFSNFLYPSDLVLPKPVTFSSGSYNNAIVRYSNLLPEQGYSCDYILQNKLLFIGNSKDVTRKAVDVGVK